ncbi:YeeE/YedE thiosulfate transporter family protein [Proteinivorax hydrogeniformans]|uniref:YeeE/YedE thiosulfate transporter family protein n=1 Tax=Proteinivorax hydrogeniformans TaxID=1826727 RepID=A0AAU8HQQ1_9FIRM
MSSSTIETLKSKKRVHFKKSQLPYALVFGVFILAVIFYLINQSGIKLGALLAIGVLLGFIIQKARFCFAGSVRNIIVLGNVKLLKAVILSLMISTVGFFVIQYLAVDSTVGIIIEQIPGQIKPVGIHTVVGALIFGIGMVLAGACVSGSLVRIGEGFALQAIVLIGIVIGTVLGGLIHFEFWDNLLSISESQAIYLPKIIGFFPALVIQLLALGGAYYCVYKYGKHKQY